MPPKPPVGTARPYGKLATRLIVALEAEARDTIGREYYEHGAAPGSGSRAIARELADGVAADFEAELPTATACFMDDFEACIAHLRMPVTHRRPIRSAVVQRNAVMAFPDDRTAQLDGRGGYFP